MALVEHVTEAKENVSEEWPHDGVKFPDIEYASWQC
jgi:hypothetical protein